MVSRVEQELLKDIQMYLGGDCDKRQEPTLLFCVKRAIQSFKNKRNYPAYYKEDYIEKDMKKFYMCLFDLALYWAIMQGVEFQNSHSENGTSRSWQSEADIYVLHNVIPVARIV